MTVRHVKYQLADDLGNLRVAGGEAEDTIRAGSGNDTVFGDASLMVTRNHSAWRLAA